MGLPSHILSPCHSFVWFQHIQVLYMLSQWLWARMSPTLLCQDSTVSLQSSTTLGLLPFNPLFLEDPQALGEKIWHIHPIWDFKIPYNNFLVSQQALSLKLRSVLNCFTKNIFLKCKTHFTPTISFVWLKTFWIYFYLCVWMCLYAYMNTVSEDTWRASQLS